MIRDGEKGSGRSVIQKFIISVKLDGGLEVFQIMCQFLFDVERIRAVVIGDIDQPIRGKGIKDIVPVEVML